MKVIKVLDEFELEEISTVDSPAQEPATFALFKNDSGAAGSQSTTKGKDSMKDNEKAPEEGLQKQLEALKAELAIAKARGTLTDEERAFCANLSDESAVEFVLKSVAERQKVLAAARDANGVIYTSDSGEEFRKSDDPRLVRLAKAADENARLAKAEREAREGEQLTKRATEQLGGLPGSLAHKVALLKAIGTVSDSASRTAIEALLDAANAAMTQLSKKQGVGGDKPVDDGAKTKLDALVKSRAAADRVNEYEALDRVMSTPEGQELAVAIREGGN